MARERTSILPKYPNWFWGEYQSDLAFKNEGDDSSRMMVTLFDSTEKKFKISSFRYPVKASLRVMTLTDLRTSSPGMSYLIETSPLRYYSYLLMQSKDEVLAQVYYVEKGEKWRRIFSRSVTELIKADYNNLSITINDKVFLSLNGKLIGAHDSEISSDAFRVGIYAHGKGEYRFNDIKIYSN